MIDALKEKQSKERMSYYNQKQWPFYEQSVDLLFEDIIKIKTQLNERALSSIDLSLTHLENSIQRHFSYPKDSQLCKIYQKVVQEFKA